MLCTGKGDVFLAGLESVCPSLADVPESPQGHRKDVANFVARKLHKIFQDVLHIADDLTIGRIILPEAIEHNVKEIDMMRDDMWSPEDFYLLQEMASLFPTYSLFLLSGRTMGCGPKSLRIGDIVSDIWPRDHPLLRSLYLTQVAGTWPGNLGALGPALAMENAKRPEDFRSQFRAEADRVGEVTGILPKARFLGAAFFVIDRAYTSVSGSFELT
jgi:hypothetical protein